MPGISTPLPSNLLMDITKLSHATQQANVAALTAAIVAAMNRPVSIGEVLEIHTDIHWALHPDNTQGRYKEWAKTKDEKFKKVWS